MTHVSSSRFPVLTFMRSLTLWLRKQQGPSSLSSWRSLMKRISVRRPCMLTYSQYSLSFSFTLSCVKCTFSVCHQPTFQPMMRMEKGSCTLPRPALYQRHPPCLRNKVCVGRTEHMQAVMSIVNQRCVHSGADRWPSSPLSRSPAPDRRILTSSVPASPTNPMRRLILSPSPLTQSEYAAQITTAVPHPDILPVQFQPNGSANGPTAAVCANVFLS